MGQCVSRKAAGAYGANSHSKPMARPHDYHRQYQGQDDNRDISRHSSASNTRGISTSFGFKRRPATAIPLTVDNGPISKKLPSDSVDSNGNDDNLDSLETAALYAAGRTTPRLAAPKKEATAIRLNRFGFRQGNGNRGSSRVPETTSPTGPPALAMEFKNNNVEKEGKTRKSVSIAATLPKSKQAACKTSDPNRNKQAKSSIPQSNAPAKFTFHSSQLPRPQMPVRVMDSKNAKTVANINRKVSSVSQRSEEGGSSKEGSVTEDSGVGSHTSGANGNLVGDTDTLHDVELMDSSPTFGARKNRNTRARNLDLIVSGKSFDVIDLDDSLEDGVVTEVAVIPLPRLPSVFGNNMATGSVRERTMEYERQLDMNRRKISVTSSEGFSEDYGEEEKSFRDRSCTEKSGQGASRLFSPTKSFRESHSRKSIHSNKDSSPASSDDQEWEQGGEAMAEVYSISFSSSDESKDKEFSPLSLRSAASNKQTHLDKPHLTSSCTGAMPKDNLRSVLLNRDDTKYTTDSARFMSTSMTDPKSTQMLGSLTGAIPKDSVRSVLLTIEDTKYSPEEISSNRSMPSAFMSTSSSSMSSSGSGTVSRDLFKSLLPTVEAVDRLPTNAISPLDSSGNSSLLTSPSSMTSSSDSLTVPRDSLKSVLLSIEDPKFAAVAAASSGTLLDDETSPVDSLISSYTESDEIVSKHKVKNNKSNSTDSKDVNEKSPLSPESPGTPTNASLSLSEGRDFLIDDEIADQPALMFNDPVPVARLQADNQHALLFNDSVERFSGSSEHHNISDSLATLVDTTPKLARRGLRSCDGSPAPTRAKNPLLSRTASIDTLSPCESIASDDLMLDFEHSQSSGMDDSTDRLHLNESNALHSLDEATIRSELENQDASVAREWSSLLGTQSNRDLPPYNSCQCNGAIPRTSSAVTRVRSDVRKQSSSAGNTPVGSPVLPRSRGKTSVTRTNNFLRSRTNTPSSVPDSPRSLDRVRGLVSTNSLLRSARTTHGSPAAYDSDDSLRLDRITHGSMVNDIVGIKTMLLKLKRVLQETGEDNLMRTEPHNPFDNQAMLKNGLYNGLSNEQSDLDSVDCDSDLASNSSMEMAELRRQIEFLQSQLEDKDRTVQQLQNQVTKYTLGSHLSSGFAERDRDMCNAATQTDRVRPLSAGPSLLQSLPSDGGLGPLVSANENARRSRPQSMVETHPSPTSGLRAPPLKLWRKPGEPPPPPTRYAQQASSLPRRARSRSRPAPTPPSS